MTDQTAADRAGKVSCACGSWVAPTVPGGERPRPHNDPDTGARCTRYTEYTAAVCKRCDGTPLRPNKLSNGKVCASHIFHPQTWIAEEGMPGAGELVGNPAACGEVLAVSGEQWGWYASQPPPGSPSRGPRPLGYDFDRKTRYWRIKPVEGLSYAEAPSAEGFRDQLPSRRVSADGD